MNSVNEPVSFVHIRQAPTWESECGVLSQGVAAVPIPSVPTSTVANSGCEGMTVKNWRSPTTASTLSSMKPAQPEQRLGGADLPSQVHEQLQEDIRGQGVRLQGEVQGGGTANVSIFISREEGRLRFTGCDSQRILLKTKFIKRRLTQEEQKQVGGSEVQTETMKMLEKLKRKRQ